MPNAYPELPVLAFAATTVAMPDVIAYLRTLDCPTEVKRAAYIMFRIESGNGAHGVNNNYVGAQADGGRWPAQFDPLIEGTVVKTENQTGKERIFVAFKSWHGSVDFLVDRVEQRGLFVGGTTHKVVTMTIADEHELARAYFKEWVTGSAAREPDAGTLATVVSIYGQAKGHFA